MSSDSDNVEVFYLDDMEDEIIVTELNLRRQNIQLDITFFLAERDMLSALDERRKASSALPDIIVTDLNMPGKGGAHLVASLRSDEAFGDVTIGVCTGSENPADHAAATAAGADFVVVKPFNHTTITQICKTTQLFELVSGDDGKDRLRQKTMPSAAA